MVAVVCGGLVLVGGAVVGGGDFKNGGKRHAEIQLTRFNCLHVAYIWREKPQK
jgi:hypothetical protein